MSDEPAETSDRRANRVRARSYVIVLAIGALLIPLAAWYGYFAYLIVQAILCSQTSLLRGPVFVLCLLMAVNGAVGAVRRRWALSGPALIALYCMLAVSTAVGGIGMVQFLVPTLASAHYFATPENRWHEFLVHIPRWLAPQDPLALRDFHQGGHTLYTPYSLRAWTVPALVWCGVVFMMAWMTLCASVLLRGQWADRERLTFPLIYLPVEMAREGGGFWRNRLMWLGFAVAGAAESVNYLNFLYPSFPYLQIKPYNVGAEITQPPWNGIGALYLASYPFMIGVGFILTLEVSFSCWFFYLLGKLEGVAAVATGMSDPGRGPTLARFPYQAEQGAGAFVGMALLVIWLARGHLAGIWRLVRAGKDSGHEIMPYRAAIVGLLACFAGLVAFASAMGVPPAMGAGLFALYLLFIITLARVVAEAGAGWTWAPTLNPHGLVFAGGMQGTPTKALVGMAYLNWWDLEYRDHPMPQQMQALRIGDAAGVSHRTLLGAMVVALVVGILGSFWAELDIFYRYGAATAKVRQWVPSMGRVPFTMLRSWMDNPTPPDPTGLAAAGVGLAVTVVLVLLRQRVLWWPLHPVGYVLAGTPSLDYMWFPLFEAWVTKLLVLRYGGMKAYRRALPFFLGLILGDYAVPTLWGVWGTITGNQMYLSFPH
jgi:hypothetical protein